MNTAEGQSIDVHNQKRKLPMRPYKVTGWISDNRITEQLVEEFLIKFKKDGLEAEFLEASSPSPVVNGCEEVCHQTLTFLVEDKRRVGLRNGQ